MWNGVFVIPLILKKGANMKFVDRFFKWILAIQIMLERIEDGYKSKRKYILLVLFATYVVGVGVILCGQMILGMIVLIFGIVFVAFDNIIGWKHSVRRWLKVCVVYNLFFSMMLAEIVQGMVKTVIVDTVFVVVYLLAWVFLSLISDSKVAMLVNEIVSGAATTIFTIGTYLVSIMLKNEPSSENYLFYFHTDEAFELALANKDVLAWNYFKIMGLESLEIAFLVFLPVIGVSALCIIMIKVKEYWVEKNEMPEPKIENGYR